MKIILTTLLLIVIGLVSCESSKLKKEASFKTSKFFSLLKDGDEKSILTIYPQFENFETYFKSDSARISSVDTKKGIVTVAVRNRFTNSFGKLTEKDILLYFKKDSTGKLNLTDSKGLSDFSEKDEYIFGISTGCVNVNIDTTDQKILNAIKNAKLVMLDKALEVYRELKEEITVATWNWESGYAGSASGKGIVRNESTFDVPKLKYKITYKDGQSNPITSDDGYITYDNIKAGESKAFIFYTSYIGDASRASIELIFDEDLIFKYLTKKDWTGKECDEYFKKHPQKDL
jgi:hypothetical protein